VPSSAMVARPAATAPRGEGEADSFVTPSR